ncbi:hypothetical protein AWB74_04876 [Caballeronia arvi]|uniref:Uncharacterized protein n=1 Tax=Caballeronia arvi TaxID=1777135 RepID=A0A158K4W2_9BURK|nr:hypothetical protein [Caballeronia arvi]SAL75793.1 hypothetical protein AWB74_04876 [Caballeronia arvi]
MVERTEFPQRGPKEVGDLYVDLQHLNALLVAIEESAASGDTERPFLLAQIGQEVARAALRQIDASGDSTNKPPDNTRNEDITALTLEDRALHRLVDNASGEFAVAEEVLADLFALFEAIGAATKTHELAHRLAALGVRTADEYRNSFEETKEKYNEHSRNIVEAMGAAGSSLRRISGDEQSSGGHA